MICEIKLIHVHLFVMSTHSISNIYVIICSLVLTSHTVWRTKKANSVSPLFTGIIYDEIEIISFFGENRQMTINFVCVFFKYNNNIFTVVVVENIVLNSALYHKGIIIKKKIFL